MKNRDVSKDEEEEEIEELEGEFLSPFECGFCLHKFSSAEKLESHVTKSHKSENPAVDDTKKRKSSSSLQMNRDLSGDILDEITDDFVSEIEKEDGKEEQDQNPSFYKKRVQVKNLTFVIFANPLDPIHWSLLRTYGLCLSRLSYL